MELTTLKELWIEVDTLQKTHQQPMMRDRVLEIKGPINRMKQTILIEVLLVLVIYGGSAIYYFTTMDGLLAEVAWFMIAIGVAFTVYYVSKFRLLATDLPMHDNIIQTLLQRLHRLKRFIRLYLIMGLILTPVSVLYFAIVLSSKIPAYSSGFFNDPMSVFQAGLVIAIVTIVMHFFNRRYINALYGLQIRRMEKLVEEIQLDE
jgi:hypothetical protein